MEEKKTSPHLEPQSKRNNKTKDSTEIFVLSPLFLQNLGISIKDIAQETPGTGKIKDDVNVENKQKVNSSHDVPVSKKIQQDETSIVETANLMKNSVFMSPTFVPQDNNENLMEIVKSEEFGTFNNLTSNEKTVSERNFAEDTTAKSVAQSAPSDALNENCHQKNCDSAQLLTENILESRAIHKISPSRNTEPSILERNILAHTTALCGAQIISSDGVNVNDVCQNRNTGSNDYACENSTLNEQNTLKLSIPNDVAIACKSHIKEDNIQNQDSNFLSQNAQVEEIQIVTDIDYHQEACAVHSDEDEQESMKKIDSFEEQTSSSDKINIEYIEILNVNKESQLISDDLIELNELIAINNNNIVNTVPENRTVNECAGVSMLIETDFMDFEDMDSLHSRDTSSQNDKNEKNYQMLEKLKKVDIIVQKQFLHGKEDVHNRNQNHVSVHPLHSKTTHDVDRNIEGAQYSFSNNATKDEVILNLSQNEEHGHLSDLPVNDDTKLCQFTKTCQTDCNKEVHVPNIPEKVNTIELVDNSEIMVFVPAVVNDIDNRNLDSITVVDVEQNKLQNCSTLTSSANKTYGKYVENNFLEQDPVQLPKSPLLINTNEKSVNCDIANTKICLGNSNLNQNLSVFQNQECLAEVSKSSNIKCKIQSKKNKAILCDKLENAALKMQEIKKYRRDYSKCEAENVKALTATYKNQCSFTENISDAVTNVNLIASYLKKITQIHSQGQKLKSLKSSKKISKLSVHGVEKPGGSKELLQEQENDFQLNTSNLNIKKTYNRKNVLSNQFLAVNPTVNKIFDETRHHNNNSLDYVEKPVSVNVTLGFCICVDYGHLFYDNNYKDLEHLHYQNKVSNDSNIINQGSLKFNFNMSLSDEISEAMRDVTETPDAHINSICWKNIEELIEQNTYITDEKNQMNNMNIVTLGNKCIEKTVRNILDNGSVETMNILKMADSDNLFKQKCCLDPKVRNRTGMDFDANDFLPVVEKGLSASNDSDFKKGCTTYGVKTFNTIEIQKLRTQSENLLSVSNSAKVDNSMEEKIQSENVDVAVPMAVSSKRSLNNFMNASDVNDCKKLKLTTDDTGRNNMNISSDQEILPQCPEFLPCDNCKLNVKTDEWINHKCLNNHIIFEEKNNLSEILETTYTVPRFIKKLLKKTKFLKCPKCRKNIKCAELYLMHVNKCRAHEKIPAEINNKNVENKESNETNRKDELIFVSHAKEKDSSPLKCICGVCYKVIDTINWVSHIHKEHDYLAWQKGETPIDFSTSRSIKDHLVKMSKTVGLLTCKHCGLKQKRCRRSYDKYIDVYLEHVEQCANQLLQVSNAATETRDLSSNQDYVIMEDINNSQSVKESTLSEVDNEVIEIEQTFVCGVCEEVVENTEWVNHIQTQHDYLAWKKGDPEIDFNGSNSVKEHLINICTTFGLLICKHCGLKQKRYRRSYERYVDVYLEHVDGCASKLIQISNVSNDTQNLSSNQEYIISEAINNRQSINESTLSKVNEEVNGIEQTLVCGVCDQVVENTQWIEHIQTQHNYLAWRKGDTEIDFNDSNSIKEHLINISKTFGLLICKHCGLKQKRYKRSYDRYIDIYLEHMDRCANQALQLLAITDKMQNQSSSQDSVIKSNVSLMVNDSTLSIVDDKNIEMKKDVICGVCEQAVESKEWFKHMQIQHNYFAWKKGDPELDVKNTYELQEHLLNICSEVRYLFCNKCGIRINRYSKTDERYVQYFMEHVEKCDSDVKDKNKAVHQDLGTNSNSMLTCNVNGFGSKIGSEETNITGSSGNIQHVTCGVCYEVISETLWIEHTKNKHNYVAWRQGDTPLDLNNLEEIRSFLIELTKNIGSLSCHKCEMILKRYKRTYENYVKVFLKHVEECNYNAVPKDKDEKVPIKGLVSCAVCSFEMNQDEWNNHLLYKHYNLAWRTGLDEQLDLQNTSVIIRQLKDYNNKNRKMTCNNCGISRISILGFFAHIVACQKSEEEIAPFQFKCEVCGASSLKVYYQQHMAAHKVQELNEEKKKLRLETALKEDEFIVNVPSGKRKAAHKAMVVLEKYKITDCKYKCDMCEFRTEYKQELLSHKCDLDDTSCVNSDDSADLSMQSSDESSGEEDENLSDEENQVVNKKKQSKESATSQKSFTVPFTVKNVDAYLKDGCNKFMEFHYTNEILFDDWLHCQFQEIPLDEVEKYLPPLAESCKIKYDNQWTSYKRFEAREHKGYCLFMGACVSCMAWVPGPDDAFQMLAVATCNSIDMPRFSYDAVYEHPGLIQIWSCGSLGNEIPYFSLGIVHDFGTVWSIDWCPSGAQTSLSENPSFTPRLGLLAVACSNGHAYIFSVPHPSSMPNKFYKLHPVAELRLWTKSDQSKHQATSISWSKQKGHSVVAVGYSNGTTAMFDLKCDSPILRYKENDTTIFHPYTDDYSVCSSITGISMYPTMEVGNRTTGLEVLGCSSTTGAMLQVRAAGGPAHAVYSKLAVNGADFMLPWPALFVTMDDNTSIKPLSELELWGVGRRAGGARAVASCVCCPLLFTWTPPLLRSVRTHPLYSEIKRNIIAAIEIVPLNDEEHKPKRQKVDDDLCFKVEPTVYEDAILKYGIQFQFVNSTKRRKSGKTFSGVARSDVYPLAEVRALAACPSPSRHNWLAVGLHSGFVVIVRT